MPRSQVQRSLERLGVRSGRVLVAASGGLDSTVLLEILRELAGPLELELVVGHVDHGLRGSASAEDARWIGDRARAAALAFFQRAIDPEREREGRSSRERPSLEEAARRGRREALESIAEEAGCRWIATAHHAGDQAETVLLRVLRGTGPEGLAAMAPMSPDGRWIRPMLEIEREALRSWARARALEWREDESNVDRRFARNRLRLDWLPELASNFNPRLLRTLCSLAEAQRRDLEWIDQLVEIAARDRIDVRPSEIRIAMEGWPEMPEALARRLARRALIEGGLGRDLSRTHLERVLEFLRRGRSVGRDKVLQLPRGIRLRRGDAVFILERSSSRNGFQPIGNATVLGRD